MVTHVLLYRNKGLIGSPIRWQTRSPYSHASIGIAGKGGTCMLWESRSNTGVVYRGLDKREENADHYLVRMDDEQRTRMMNWLDRQVGKKYDFTMIMRFITRRQEARRSTERWFCSELVYAALRKAGIELLANTEPWEVSPGLLARSPLLHVIP